MASKIEVVGMDEVVAMLVDMPIKVNTAIRRANATLVRQARDEVKAATPVVTGDLKNSIAVKGAKPKNGKFSYAVIARQNGGKMGQGYHYHLVEYGTKKMTARRFAAPIRQKYTGDAGSSLFISRLQAVINTAIEKSKAK